MLFDAGFLRAEVRGLQLPGRALVVDFAREMEVYIRGLGKDFV